MLSYIQIMLLFVAFYKLFLMLIKIKCAFMVHVKE